MVTDSASLCALLGVSLDVGNSNNDVTIVSHASDCPTVPAPIYEEPTESAPNNIEAPPETALNHREPVTEAYYYQKLRESADRFAYQLSTS